MTDSRSDAPTIDPPGAGAQTVEFIVIGGGIAGASVAYFLAPHGRIVLLERESQPGYHSTGRSAAMYMASYGNAQVRALTRASLAFLMHPPQDFAEAPLLAPRGAMWVADTAQAPQLAELAAELARSGSEARRLTPEQALAMVPALRREAVAAALYEPDAFDMDVHALHQGFLKGLRRAGGRVVCGAEVSALKHDGSLWAVTTNIGQWRAPVVLNAAGAWADQVAVLAGVPPIGLVPKRRSAFVFAPPDGLEFEHWPLVVSAGEDWYFKPDAGALLGSPANADPTTAQDVQPEELDIALGVHRINEVTTLDIRRPQRPWAGLRSFVADGGLVGGFDPQAPGFFWVAAQGGYGVQTAPAMGQACAALARGLPLLPSHVAAEGLSEAELGAARLAFNDRRAAA